jgi:hypothetical protein
MSDEAYDSYVKKCKEWGLKPTKKEKLEQGEGAEEVKGEE